MPDLKQQIAILYDMEMNNFLMTRLIEELYFKINQLGKKREIPKPQFPFNGLTFGTMFLGIIFAIIVSIIHTSTTTYLPPNDGPFDKIGNFIVMFIISGIAGIIIGGILGAIIDSISSSKAYNKEIEAENNRVRKELCKQKILIEIKNALVQRKNEASQRLQNMYAMTNIDSMFWALIPMAYMHLFSRLNIATTLGGENGLYAKVLNELKQDQFQKESFQRLGRISSSQLYEMNNNQRNIYQQLVNLNNKCNTMIDQTMKFAEISAQNNQLLENVVKNTDIAKYNSERIRKELEYQNMMEYDRRYYN